MLTDFIQLSEKIKKLVHSKVSIHTGFTQDNYGGMILNDFARWIVKADRQYPVEIFTTNYDYLFELGLEYNDAHINERILSGLRNSNTSHIFVLFYDIEWKEGKKRYTLTEDSDLGKIAMKNNRISVFGCRNTVIGGQYGVWKLKREPDKDETINVNYYFDEDAPVEDATLTKEEKGEQKWTGLGELMLPDFSKFVRFLQSMIIEWREEGKL